MESTEPGSRRTERIGCCIAEPSPSTLPKFRGVLPPVPSISRIHVTLNKIPQTRATYSASPDRVVENDFSRSSAGIFV
ncbi:MAG TPA: hypothetical protein VNO31_29745, partial [Umezawaea sp.]|nr:hypothetical protein [Umezawaea sp.]